MACFECSFGEVIKVKKYIDGNFYAIKRSIQPLYSFQEKQNLLREVGLVVLLVLNQPLRKGLIRSLAGACFKFRREE